MSTIKLNIPNEFYMKDFADRIKHLRATANMNSADFAKKLGIGAGTLNSYENGKTIPSYTKAVHISERLGVSVKWLLHGESESPANQEPNSKELLADIPYASIVRSFQEKLPKQHHAEIKTFADRIKYLRKMSGLNSKEFAKKLGIGSGTLSSYENGTTVPSGERLARISENTGKSREWLLFGSDSENKENVVAGASVGQFDEMLTDVRQESGQICNRIESAGLSVADIELLRSENKKHLLEINNLLRENAALLKEKVEWQAERVQLKEVISNLHAKLERPTACCNEVAGSEQAAANQIFTGDKPLNNLHK